MKINEKTMLGIGVAAGAAGAVLACIPAVIGLSKNKGAPSLLAEGDKITVKGGRFADSNGSEFCFKLLAPDNGTVALADKQKFDSRFGTYGSTQLIRKYEDCYFSDSDMELAASLGFNSVMLTFGHTMLFDNGKISKNPDFSRLDSILDKLAAKGLRAVLHLNDAAQKTKKDKPGQNLLSLWKELAARYAANPAAAAFKLTFDDSKALKKAAKAIRKLDESRIIILNESEAALARSIGGCALLVNGKTVNNDDVPSILLLSDAEDTAAAVSRGRSAAFTAYKCEWGKTGIFENMLLTYDCESTPYEELMLKFASELGVSNCVKNEELCRIFSSSDSFCIKSDNTSEPGKKGFTFKAGIRSGKKETVFSR